MDYNSSLSLKLPKITGGDDLVQKVEPDLNSVGVISYILAGLNSQTWVFSN